MIAAGVAITAFRLLEQRGILAARKLGAYAVVFGIISLLVVVALLVFGPFTLYNFIPAVAGALYLIVYGAILIARGTSIHATGV
jgi:hypothetical protein